jgi:hypothetical protein
MVIYLKLEVGSEPDARLLALMDLIRSQCIGYDLWLGAKVFSII